MGSEFPAASQSRFLSIDGQRMHYVDSGSGSSPEGGAPLSPMLMVHGNPTWSFYYRRLIESFSGRFRCLAVDHIGCGLSDKPQRYDYRLDRHIENLCELIRRLDLQQIHLVVHDWGGPIGLAAALEMPQRIAQLIVLNTGCFPPPYVPWRILACRTPLLGAVLIRGLNAFCRAAARQATARAGGLDREARAGLLRPYDTWGNRVAIHGFVRDIPLSRKSPTWRRLADIERRLPELDSRPSLLVWGMKDWCFRPECLRRIQQLLPSNVTVEIPQAGHYVLEDAPEQVIGAIESFVAGGMRENR
jgi:haloalkane dehalogenase